MVTGTLLCCFIRDQWSAQIWLVFFLSLHLFLNWCAVRSVHLRSLNRQRANLVFSQLEDKDEILTPIQVADRERIFETRAGSVFRWRGKDIIGSCDFGMPLSSMIACVTHRSVKVSSKKPFLGTGSLSNLMEIFEGEEYLLYYHVPEPLWKSSRAGRVRVTVVLKEGVTPENQLKAWFHGLVLARRLNEQQDSDTAVLSTKNFNTKQKANIKHVTSTLRYVNSTFDSYVSRLQAQGWDCSIPVLETRSGSRIVCDYSDY
jgi:hypothetical protein